MLEEFVGASEIVNQGERVVAGQRIMQAASDIFLGWLHIPESGFGEERDYYVRQLRDWKGSIAVEAMDPQDQRLRGALLGHPGPRPFPLGRPDRDRRATSAGGAVFDRAVLAFRRATRSRTTATSRPCAARSQRARGGRHKSVIRPARRHLEGGENLAGAIYGTILVTSVVAAADSSDAIWQSLGIVEVTVLVFWLAHVYAHALAWSLDSKQPFSARELRPIARKEWPLLQAAVVPTIALVAGGVGLIGTQTAYWLAIGYGVVALVWWGLLIARKERLSLAATCALVAANAFFGLAIVLLKEFVNH